MVKRITVGKSYLYDGRVWHATMRVKVHAKGGNFTVVTFTAPGYGGVELCMQARTDNSDEGRAFLARVSRSGCRCIMCKPQ